MGFHTFLLTQFNRLELYVLDCPSYTATLPEKVAVVLSYSALFVYVFFGITAVYSNRTVFHWLLWTGFFCASASNTLADNLLPTDAFLPAACSEHGVSVCPEASVLAYVYLFFFFYHMHLAESDWIYSALVFVLLTLLSFAGFTSLLALELYTIPEVGMGALIGGIWALVFSLLGILFMEPRSKDGRLDKFKETMRLKKQFR